MVSPYAQWTHRNLRSGRFAAGKMPTEFNRVTDLTLDTPAILRLGLRGTTMRSMTLRTVSRAFPEVVLRAGPSPKGTPLGGRPQRTQMTPSHFLLPSLPPLQGTAGYTGLAVRASLNTDTPCPSARGRALTQRPDQTLLAGREASAAPLVEPEQSSPSALT